MQFIQPLWPAYPEIFLLGAVCVILVADLFVKDENRIVTYALTQAGARVVMLARTKSELESRGVEFRGDTIDSGVCYQAFFQDPDGNVLGIHHRYAEGAPPATTS